MFQPLSRGILRDMHFYHWWQASQKDLTQSWIARQVSAHEFGDFAPAADSRHFVSLGQVFRKGAQGVYWRYGSAIPQDVLVAVREYYDVAGGQLFPLSIRVFRISAPFG